ncbi:MAG: hypothetical protein ACRCZO_10430, partial [Cetobacterium sp.]
RWILYYCCSQKPLLFLSGGVTVLGASLRAQTRLSPLRPALAVRFFEASSYGAIGKGYKTCSRSDPMKNMFLIMSSNFKSDVLSALKKNYTLNQL